MIVRVCSVVLRRTVVGVDTPSQDYTTNPDDHSNHNTDSPGFKPFTVIRKNCLKQVDKLKILGVTFQENNRFNEHVKK